MSNPADLPLTTANALVHHAAPERAPIRIGIADDHPIVRTALRCWLLEQPDICVQGEAADGSEALELVKRHPLDVLLLDLTMPKRDGFDIIRSLRAAAPGTAILVFSGHPEALFARKLLAQGVRGYLHKSCDPAQLVVAIRKVATGHCYLSDTLSEQFSTGAQEGGLSLHDGLSRREFQILLLLAVGNKPASIAQKLHLSAKTITLYRSRLVRKLELSTNSELTHYAVRHGLLD